MYEKPGLDAWGNDILVEFSAWRWHDGDKCCMVNSRSCRQLSFEKIKKKCVKKKSVFLQPVLKFIIMSEILEKVQSIIAEKLSVDAADVTPEKSFTNDLGADSLDTVELIMEFENVFGIKIPDEETEKIMTVGDAVAYIESKVAPK